MKENDDITVLGFAWSCYWRIAVVFFIAGFLFALITG